MRAHLLTAVKLLLLLLRPDLSSSLDQKSGLTIPSSNVGSIFWRDSFVVRGGSSKLDLDDAVDQLDADVDDEDGEIDEDDSDVLEEQRDKKRLDTKLTHSAMHSAVKVQVKKITETKEAVSSSLKMKKAKQKGKLLKALRLPYIIRAVMNPITVFLMTRAYFASLFNLNFMKEQQDSSQNLRSAMEEKAKKKGGDSQRKGKRQMKPGQAKTLSDLPQLSA